MLAVDAAERGRVGAAAVLDQAAWAAPANSGPGQLPDVQQVTVGAAGEYLQLSVEPGDYCRAAVGDRRAEWYGALPGRASRRRLPDLGNLPGLRPGEHDQAAVLRGRDRGVGGVSRTARQRGPSGPGAVSGAGCYQRAVTCPCDDFGTAVGVGRGGHPELLADRRRRGRAGQPG